MNTAVDWLIFQKWVLGKAGSKWAYVGPGLGAGIIAVIIGFFLSIVLAIVAVIWFPIKRLLRKDKLKREPDPAEDG